MPVIDDDATIEQLLRTSRTVAIVGLSDKPYRDSYVIARYLLSHGYTIYPVNPAVDSVLGLPSYPDLRSIGAPPDIVDVFRRPEHLPQVAEEAVAVGARALWFQLGVTHPGASLFASAHGLQVVEDRCIMVEHRRLLV